MEQKLTVPISIILAGVIIALAIIFTSPGKSAPATNIASDSQINTSNIVAPITSSDHLLGSSSAPITVVEYSDLECPYCKIFQKTMNQLMDAYSKDGKVAWVYRHFPIYKSVGGQPPLHSKSGKESEATYCASELGGNDKFWAYINEIYSITPSNNKLDPALLSTTAVKIGLDRVKFDSCLSSGKYANQVSSDYDAAAKAGAHGTPYSVLIMKTPLSKDKEQQITSLFKQNQAPTDLYSFNKDGTELFLSGAMPYGLMDSLIQLILK